MNDHVGKPFDLEHLVAVLLRLAGRATPNITERHGNGQATALSPKILAAAAEAGVDIQRALVRMGGKLKVYGRMLHGFATDLQGMPEQLASQLQRGERDAVRRDLHTLKGVAATVGATALSKLAGEAETQLASISPASDEADCVTRVGTAIAGATASLKVLCAALDSENEVVSAGPVATAMTPTDTALLASLLRTLQGFLQASDLDAADALQTLRSRLPAAAGPRLDALETAVESLEFESALSHCGEWLLECET
jgi:HPt (histidine-containing phosphotransfer) domain-containing protein